MDDVSTELTQNSDASWTLKIIGSVGPRTNHLIWSVDSSATLLKKLVDAKATKLLIDLTLAERFDSHGLRLLLGARKEFAKENIPIVLRNPNPHLNRLFQIMRFDQAFEIEFSDG